ncbi:hypothetical protein PUNSTDRAFT_124859 [Punctularia strigosozonata HHB-11173 SS5]|uniref:uncharacterized protein n=1 Tax=Punctularia strigosozonata (strain HHB-11173) TaxID=741275 RepID=UPI00044167F6|nr:uncharacterized protein PUNSTDRAFT_124859 [Punctularia strigosozonata HHB-11173 SS5]EIN11565.1 hypothetical protein PUNSTDRAFT_124859 [Punctularia strigosozonata HHB-11173 SS5]
MNWTDRIVDVETDLPERELRSKLSEACGEMTRFLPWDTSTDGVPVSHQQRRRRHYFVEFRFASFGRDEDRLPKLPETRIQPLCTNAQLIWPYMQASRERPSGGLQAPLQNIPNVSNAPDGDSPRILPLNGVTTVPLAAKSPLRKSTGSFLKDLKFRVSENDDPSKPIADPDKNPSALRPSFASPSYGPSTTSEVLLSPQCTVPVHVPFTLHNTLTLSLAGRLVSVDLDAADDDPQAIIALLCEAQSEKDQWMIAGAHYRRRGLPQAAIATVDAMLGVMAKQTPAVNIADLKPVQLFMSSCHTDLMRRARTPAGKETPESRAHFDQAKMWLQKVYGREVPALPPPPSTRGVLLDTGARSAVAGVRERSMVAQLPHSGSETSQPTKRRLDSLGDEPGNERTSRRRIEQGKDCEEGFGGAVMASMKV